MGAQSKNTNRKLLILDVNGLLVHRVFNPNQDQELPDYPHVQCLEFSVFLRPDCVEFIRWCSSRFVVVVWSNAMKVNVEPLVELAFAGCEDRPVAVLDQSDCVHTGVSHPDKPAKKLMLKPMSHVWGLEKVIEAGPFGESDTLMLDDSPYKALDNPDNTALYPREWTPKTEDPAVMNALGPDGEIRRMLERFAEAPDGRDIISVHNGEKHEQWALPQEDPLYHHLLQKRLGASDRAD